ncbi:MAG TPA: peptidylprolyl isomerase [Tenuifilaceae bacterium]|nr:peptidylprolyl isomerase [Tenuifilaceae bacterium]HPN21894.1 peptidylprolyl isomerase [Tenuifilaceae bacterium]
MRRVKGIIVVAITALACNIAISQPLSQKVLLTIADNPVTVDEFKSIYLKNNVSGTSIDKAVLEDYLKLFINFKLKVQAAKEAKIDTSSAFISEYQGYIKQLAQPYLTDAASDEQLLNEAYERMQYEVSASHILINVPENASPADTLLLYKKALEARTRILKGEQFGAVALSTSNDPSVARNSGYLGYFTAFQMVYPFETAAYNTPIDSISKPVRTRFGYHIIKVHGKRPAQGQVKVAHIMIRVQPNANPQDAENARKKIVEISDKLKAGTDFATIAKEESQDPSTAKNGGELPWLSSGQIIPEFERVAFGLSADGQISEPFQSTFGWHIVKRLGRKMVGTKEEMLPEIKSNVARDSRNQKSRESFIKKIKKEYNFKEDTAKLKVITELLDSSLYRGEWKAKTVKDNAVIFEFTGGSYRISNFASFMEANQRFIGQNTLKGFIKVAYGEWINRIILEFEENRLPEKHPEFKQLSKEYLEGMLLFEITNQMVWQKSSDSIGIANYYDTHKNQYTWGERVHYAVYTLKNAKIKEKFVSGLAKRKSNNINPKDYIEKFNKKGEVITVEEKSANTDFPDVLNFKTWKNGINVTTDKDGSILVTEILATTTGDQKMLDDCRGQVIADYQETLESEWIDTLKAKFPVKVSDEVFTELVESVK